jgi:hypothetical protein
LIEETGHRRCRLLRVRRAGYETSAYSPCELAPPHFAAPGKRLRYVFLKVAHSGDPRL